LVKQTISGLIAGVELMVNLNFDELLTVDAEDVIAERGRLQAIVGRVN
jgi:hypothetical protein